MADSRSSRFEFNGRDGDLTWQLCVDGTPNDVVWHAAVELSSGRHTAVSSDGGPVLPDGEQLSLTILGSPGDTLFAIGFVDYSISNVILKTARGELVKLSELAVMTVRPHRCFVGVIPAGEDPHAAVGRDTSGEKLVEHVIPWGLRKK